MHAEWFNGFRRVNLTVTCLQSGQRQLPSNWDDVVAALTGVLHEEYGVVPKFDKDELTVITLEASFRRPIELLEDRAHLISLCTEALNTQLSVAETHYVGRDASGRATVTLKAGERLHIDD